MPHSSNSLKAGSYRCVWMSVTGADITMSSTCLAKRVRPASTRVVLIGATRYERTPGEATRNPGFQMRTVSLHCRRHRAEHRRLADEPYLGIGFNLRVCE